MSAPHTHHLLFQTHGPGSHAHEYPDFVLRAVREETLHYLLDYMDTVRELRNQAPEPPNGELELRLTRTSQEVWLTDGPEGAADDEVFRAFREREASFVLLSSEDAERFREAAPPPGQLWGGQSDFLLVSSTHAYWRTMLFLEENNFRLETGGLTRAAIVRLLLLEAEGEIAEALLEEHWEFGFELGRRSPERAYLWDVLSVLEAGPQVSGAGEVDVLDRVSGDFLDGLRRPEQDLGRDEQERLEALKEEKASR